MNTQHLIERFADAGLTLALADAPLVPGEAARAIFQMDIRRRRTRDMHSEHFVLWPGHEDNLAVVQGLEPRLRQLVLMVREPRREFFEPFPAWTVRAARRTRPDHYLQELATRAGARPADVVEHAGNVFLRRVTLDRKRHFLAGRDERQLFMCRLPRACTTVSQAHGALRAPGVPPVRGGTGGTIRQGEWFFVALSDGELASVETELARGRAIVRRKRALGAVLGRGGKPHVADEIVVVRNADGALVVYARGAVRHVDHRTIHLASWRHVVANREVVENRSVFGGTWID